MSEESPVLEMRNITKSFPGVLAIDDVDFDVLPQEIHGLLGENGAGKTTLMKVLYGLYKKDDGQILCDNEEVTINSPVDAKRVGIGMVEQEPKLIHTVPVWKNIVIGNEPTKNYLVDGKKAESELKKLQEEYGIEVDLKVKPSDLSSGEKKATQILKVLYQRPKILILDEPTAFLTEMEKEKLMGTLREMATKGEMSIVFITHKLHEIMEVTDRVTVLRNGKVRDTVSTNEASIQDLVRLMIGREILFKEEKELSEKGEKLFEIEGLSAIDEEGREVLKDISLTVKNGEIFGIAGVSGNGQKELLEVLMAQKKAKSGDLFYKGEEWTDDLRKEVAYIPEDHDDSIVAGCSVMENLVLGGHNDSPLACSGIFPSYFGNVCIDREAWRDYSEKLVDQYEIKTPNLYVDADTLSGGNRQRVVLARELSRSHDFIIANKPTAGLDVGSQEFIRELLIDEAKEGKGILLISEDLDEIMLMADKIGVMYEGEMVGVLNREEATKKKIGRTMGGEVL